MAPPIRVAQVLSGSSAEEQGVAVGDEVVSAGGLDFESLTPYQRPWALLDQKEHATLPLTLLRKGQKIAVTLETRALLTDPKLD